LRGTAGGAVAPLTTQGRLAPAGLVPELALSALRAIESELGRLVIFQVGRKTVILIRPPDQPAFDAAGNQSDLLGAHASDSGACLRRPDCRRAQGNEAPERQSNRQVQSVLGASLTRVRWEVCSCAPPGARALPEGSGIAICGNFLMTSLALTVKRPRSRPYPRGEREGRRIYPSPGLAPDATPRP
jgi:hypothetical protein